MSVPHFCCADCNETKNSQEHYQNLVSVKRHKCIGTYYLRQKNAWIEQNMASHTVNLDSHSISNGHGVLNLLKCRMVESGIIS